MGQVRYSPETDKLFPALALFQSKITPPPKTRTVNVTHKSGGQHSFTYAELSTILVHVAGPFAEAGLFWTCDVTFRDGGPMLTTRVGHVSNQWMEGDFPLPNITDTKGFAGEITYARRYMFSMMTGISSQEDGEDIPGSQAHQRGRDRNLDRQPKPAATGTGGPKPQPKATSAGWPVQTNPSITNASSPAPVVKPMSANPGPKERDAIAKLAAEKYWPFEQVQTYMALAYDVKKLDQLTMAQYSEIMRLIPTMAAEEAVYLMKSQREAEKRQAETQPAAAPQSLQPGDFGHEPRSDG